MYLRRLAVPVAAIAAGAAFLPASAFAATSHQVPAVHGSSLATGAAASAFKSFSSPASKSVRVQKAATTPIKSHTSATGKTIYTTTANLCSVDTGDGTQTNPYCIVQDAVNAAAPGDTIDVNGSTGYFAQHPVAVTTSDISIVGTSDQSWIFPTNADSGKPALILNGVTGVTISNLMLTSGGGPTVEVIGSSNVTFDSDYIDQRSRSVSDTFTVDGASSGVTVSRTYVDNGYSNAPSHAAISIASGASNVTLAGDVIAASGIKATDVRGLNVAGDTIQRVCTPGIDVEGASTGVHLEDNVVEDANPNTDYMMGGYQSACTAASQTWQPDIAVSSGSSAATTVDYNDFYIYGSDATAPYSWAGTAYATLAAFQSAVGQATHDTLDGVEFGGIYFRANESDNVDAKPVRYSAALGSANPSAPGELSSDFYGVSPYNSRGAIQYVSPDPNLALSLAAQDTSALGISFQAAVTSTNVALNLTVNWGEGISSNTSFTGSNTAFMTHTYTEAGTHTISATVTDNQGDTVTNSMQVTVAGSDYTAYGPARILDTRKGVGTGGAVAKVGANSTLKLQVTGAGSQGSTIPSGITAVVLNLTVTNPSSGGYLTAYPNEDPSGAPMNRPTSSNVNFSPGQTVPNLTIVPVGKDGIVDLYNGSAGGTDAVADVTGYFTQSAASGYTSLTPDRLVDTRKGVGAAKAQVPANGSIPVQIAGADGGLLPPTGATAVALNVTTVNAKAGGYLTVYPDAGTRPTASNLNFSAGQVIANAVIVPVGADGKIDVYNGSGGGTDVVVDVVGYYSATSTSAYLPVAPVRVLDTRTAGAGPLPAGSYAILYSRASVTDPGLTSFVFNTTVANTKGSGYETVAPDPNTLVDYQNGTAVWPTPPTVSTLNWSQGHVVPNLVQASTGRNGIIDVWNRSGGNMDLVVDEFGYYQAD